MRPEHFEDAAVAETPGLRFRTKIDVVESMGSELYAYFDVESEAAQSSDLAELAKDAGMEDVPGGGAQHVVARLSAQSNAAAGQEAELVLDTSQIKLFDVKDGHSLNAPR
jgi:multiple sugar transport system ATP-binding protein